MKKRKKFFLFKHRITVVTGFLFVLLTAVYQNCVPEKMVNEKGSYSGLAELSPNCMNDQRFDSCLYLKDPVSQMGKVLPTSERDRVVLAEKIQKFGISLDDLDASGFLQNKSFQVLSAKYPRATAQEKNWKFKYSENDRRLAQVSAYFWLNRATLVLQQRSGVFYAAEKQMVVVTDAPATGWSMSQNAIYLQDSSSDYHTAFDAGILIHMLGRANLDYATQGQLLNVDYSADHNPCGPTQDNQHPAGCCKSALGCSRAIQNGVSDYFVALVFLDSPGLGEYWTNRLEGLSFCGVSRNLNLSRDLNSETAFLACKEVGWSDSQNSFHGNSGVVEVMGGVYASIWWNVRAQVAAFGAGRVADLDRLFMLHLRDIRPTDNFQTILTENILILDQKEFGGFFKDFFEKEYHNKGL